MEIIVLGAGAIGSLFGAKLATTNDVTLVGRSEHVGAINSRGLRMEGLESRVVPVRAVTAIEKIRTETLVILTTKVCDSRAALEPIARLIRQDTVVLCLQNGLGSEAIARAALGQRGTVLRGITQAGAIFKAPGVIEFMARGYTVIEGHERSAAIARTFSEAGLDCRISSDIKTDVWNKLVINCVVNPITAILGCDVGGIANPQLQPLKRLVIDECVAVAASQGAPLLEDLQQQIDDFFRPSHNLASMLQDLRRGHVTEIDYLNGAVAALAARQNIPCPVNAALTAIIKAMEARPQPPGSN
jgi:2-dehydropantoate 2-reductase